MHYRFLIKYKKDIMKNTSLEGKKQSMSEQNDSVTATRAQRRMVRSWAKQPDIEARDCRIFIDPKQTIKRLEGSLNPQSKRIMRRWLVAVFENITSDAFKKYSGNLLKIEQAKAYAAKNYLLNINEIMVGLRRKMPQQKKIQYFNFLNQESQNIIEELILKYPQSSQKGGVRKLKKAISRPDNRESDQYDLLRFPELTKVKFQYKQNGNYASQIMRSLNYIMEVASHPLHEQNQFQTNFDGFQLMLESIFTSSGCKIFEDQFFIQLKQYIKTSNKEKQDNFEKLFETTKQKANEVLEAFRSKNSNETKYKINQKIPSDIKTFSQVQIESGLFRVPDVSILRVMTKWAEQLREKLKNARDLILKRVELFKDTEGNLIELNDEQRSLLFEIASVEEVEIKKFFKSLQINESVMGAKLTQQSFQSLYTNDDDANIGIFAARTQTIIGKYMFSYLNQLLHSLMKIPKLAKQRFQKLYPKNEEDAHTIGSINLVSFKIGDLLRARCKSNEKQIINIYKMLAKISQQYPQFLKIVRVKDRLDTKDSDILINLFFMNKVQCQVQISVHSSIDAKQQQYNSFNHFIYQLKRAQFGPIAQCACILAQFDPVVRNYTQRQSLSPQIYITQRRVALSRSQCLNKRELDICDKSLINLAFFCYFCNRFIKNTNPFFYKNRIHSLKYQECNECYEDFLKKDSSGKWLQELLGEKYVDKDYQIIIKSFEIVNFKEYDSLQKIKAIQCGLLISKNAQNPNPQYFNLFKFGEQLFFVTAQKQAQSSHYTSKILLVLNEFTNWMQSLENVIILKRKNPEKDKIEIIDGEIVLKSQNNELHLSKQFNYQHDVLLQKNLELIKNTYKMQKQTLFICHRGVTNQLDKITEMKKVKRFFAFNNKIKHLNFLHQFPKTQTMDVSHNQINTIQPIKFCRQIRQFKCSFNKNLEIMEGFKELYSIQVIQLNNCNISKIENIGNLASLKKLSLSKNKITVIENMDNLHDLVMLNLSENSIEEIKNIQNLNSLKILNLDQNKIKKIENLNNLTKLTSLSIERNQIKNICNLQNLKNLESLELNQNQIQKIQGIQQLTKLTSLNLQSNQISKLENMQNLINLSIIQFSKNKIQIIQNLQQQKQLRKLNLSQNKIRKITGLQAQKKLNELNLGYNIIEKVQNLDNLKELRVLKLNNNKITTIEKMKGGDQMTCFLLNNNEIQNAFLPHLKLLRQIDLSFNKIKVVEAFHNTPELVKLNLSNNKINQFKNLKGMHKLRKLALVDLSHNNLSQFEFKFVKSLTQVILKNNLIDVKKNAESIKRLTDKGVKVTFKQTQEEVFYSKIQSNFEEMLASQRKQSAQSQNQS